MSGCDGPIRPSFVRSRACAFGPGFSRQRVAFVIGWHGCVRFLSACRYCTAEERFFPGMCGRPLSVRPRRTGPAGRRNECRFCPVVIVLVPVCGRDKSCGGKGLRQARFRPVFAFLSGRGFFVRSASGGTRCAGVGVSGRHRRRLGCGRRDDRAGFRKKVGCVAACGFCLSGDGRRDDVLFARNLQFIVCGRAKMRVVWNAFIIFAIGCTDFGSGRRKP